MTISTLATKIQGRQLQRLSADEIHTYYDADDDPIIDNTSYSLSGLQERLQALGTPVEVLVNTAPLIRALPVGGDTLEKMLITGGGDAGGVDFSRAELRAQIAYNESILSGVSQTTEVQGMRLLLSKMLLVGVRTNKRWENDGLPSLPSVEEIQTALDELAVLEAAQYSHRVYNKLINLRNAAMNLASDKEVMLTMTATDAKALFHAADVDAVIAMLQDFRLEIA